MRVPLSVIAPLVDTVRSLPTVTVPKSTAPVVVMLAADPTVAAVTFTGPPPVKVK